MIDIEIVRELIALSLVIGILLVMYRGIVYHQCVFCLMGELFGLVFYVAGFALFVESLAGNFMFPIVGIALSFVSMGLGILWLLPKEEHFI